MKLTKDQVCVYIENEAQLQEARELLEKYGEKVGLYDDDMVLEMNNVKYPYFRKAKTGNYWFLSQITWNNEIITLQELETILKEQ